MPSPVARRYALALYEEARAQGVAEQVDADVRALADALAASRELRAALTSPVVSRPKKAAVLKRLFGGGRVHPLVERFLALLVRKEREALAPEVLAAYDELRDRRAGIVEARVRAARPLSPDEAAALERALAARTGRTVRLRLDVDPALLGGLVVRLGDRVYDGSLRHQLGVLREQLLDRAQLATN